MANQQLRVWAIPQVGMPGNAFRWPVESVAEGANLLDALAQYDLYQYMHHIKPDYANAMGLEMYNEEVDEWEDWYYEDEENYFDSGHIGDYLAWLREQEAGD